MKSGVLIERLIGNQSERARMENKSENTDHVPYSPGMILMPGQSTSIAVELPPEVAAAIMQQGGRFVLEKVPAPTRAIVHDLAETLGLCAGLRAERYNDKFSCTTCHRLYAKGNWLVWVPDSVWLSRNLPTELVTEACRQNTYNGHWSAWCLACAHKLGTPYKGLLARLWDRLRGI